MQENLQNQAVNSCELHNIEHCQHWKMQEILQNWGKSLAELQENLHFGVNQNGAMLLFGLLFGMNMCALAVAVSLYGIKV